MNGKGDKPRPVDKKKFDTNHDEIRWKSKATDAGKGTAHPRRTTTSLQKQD